jgi:gluconate kinase
VAAHPPPPEDDDDLRSLVALHRQLLREWRAERQRTAQTMQVLIVACVALAALYVDALRVTREELRRR